MDAQMAVDVPPPTPGEAEWIASQRKWLGSWRRGALAALPLSSQISWRRYWAYFILLFVLSVAGLPFAHAAGFVAFIFLTVLSVGRLRRWSLPLVAAFSLAALIVPVVIPSWDVSLGASFDDVTPVAIPVVAITMFAIVQVMRGNQALAEARAELAQLAAENERIRIAEVEDLCRQALTDVRSAVSGYRDVTLAGELARGRELLRASGIAADLPTATDTVDPAHQELLGWAVREGLTNVVRHSRAGTCAVRLARSGVEITDDGVGAAAPAGNGLSGLRERVVAAGGSVEAGPAQPGGWRLQVSMPAERGT